MSISILNRGASGGMTASIKVNGLSESDIVTASNGSKNKNAMWNADGYHEINGIKDLGLWTVTATNGEDTTTQNILIEAIGLYEIAMSYIDPVFANNSWDKIIKACQTNKVPDTWNVGDQKDMVINNSTCPIIIIDKNHDTYTDGGGTAPLTFFTANSVVGAPIDTSNKSTAGWGGCTMRNTTLPNCLLTMPEEVQEGISAVNKDTRGYAQGAAIGTTSDKLFLLSEIEVLGYVDNSQTGEGYQYSYFANAGTWPSATWLRSPWPGKSDRWICTGTSSITYSTPGNSRATKVAFCF